MGAAAITGFTICVYVFMFAPIAVVVLLSFNSAQFGSFPIEGFSLRWFHELANNAAIVRAFKTSMLLAVLTSVIESHAQPGIRASQLAHTLAVSARGIKENARDVDDLRELLGGLVTMTVGLLSASEPAMG